MSRYQVLPPLDDDDYAALKDDIRQRGILVPIEMDDQGNVLDGHHRLRAWQELRAEGVKLPDYPTIIRVGLTERQKLEHVLALNLERRHLTREQKRQLVAEYLRRDPEATDREVARQIGLSPTTVGDVRRELGESVQIGHFSHRRDPRTGRLSQPATKPAVIARTTREARQVLEALPHVETDQLPSTLLDARAEPIRQASRETRRVAEAAAPKPEPPRDLPVQIVVADARRLPLPDCCVDLIVTSPPYGLDKPYPDADVDADAWVQFMEEWLREAYRVAKIGGRLALNVPLDTTEGGFRPTYAQAVQAAVFVGWTYRSTIVWAEGNVSKSTGRGSVDSAAAPHVIAPVEMVALFSRGEWRREPPTASDLEHEEWLAWTNGLWTFPGESRPWEGHPAPFPEELPRRLIKLLSFPGDTVLDPFNGSGTTTLAAWQLGRHALGFDRSETYVAAARRRLAGAVGNGSGVSLRL